MFFVLLFHVFDGAGLSSALSPAEKSRLGCRNTVGGFGKMSIFILARKKKIVKKGKLMVHRILSYPGAKWRIAPWIIEKMPKHHSYLEPYFGSGAVLFNKPPSAIETINDINGDVVNFFYVLRDKPQELAERVCLIPYVREVYENSFSEGKDEIDRAVRLLVKCWQGYAYKTNSKTPYTNGWRRDVQGREAAYAVRNWNSLPGYLTEAADRLKMVQIEHKPALGLIRAFNYKNVCIYADPPYLLSTRHSAQYADELTDKDHCLLLEALLDHKGSALISGYDSKIYNEYLKNWTRYECKNLTGKGRERTECLWVKEL